MTATYCAIIFQIITYWGSGTVIKVAMKEQSCRLAHTKTMLDDLNYASAEYEHEVLTWGASLRDHEIVPPKDLLRELSYFVEFDGDGRGCYDRGSD